MAFANKKDIDLTNYVQKVSDDLQEISAEISYENPVDKPTDPATKQYVDSKFALANHNHDNRYFTETESDARFAALSDARFALSHTIMMTVISQNQKVI